MVEWTKISHMENFVLPSDTVYILPYDEGIQIVYDGEVCKIANIGVQEFVEAIKFFEDPLSFKTDFKTEVDKLVNRLILPQKPLTT